MKRIYFFVILFVVAVVTVNAQVPKIFEQYSDAKGVNLVYISKAMLGMGANLSGGESDLKGITDKLNYIRVLSTENAALVEKIDKQLTDEIKKDAYELLISAQEDGEKANIYMKTDSNGVSDYLIVASEPGELSVVLINGMIKPEDIQKMKIK